MHRNTATGANHGQRPTHPLDSRVLPVYQRLLTPSNVYPYQSPPPQQNGMTQPGLFLIDKGRKTIKIAGGSPVTINQPSQGRQSQPNATPQPTVPITSDRRVSLAKTPETPNTYKLLVQVLGDKAKIETQSRDPSAPTATDSRLQPQTSTQSVTQANGPGKSTEPRYSAMNSRMASKDKNRKSSSASDDVGKSREKAVFIHTYAERPSGHSTAHKGRAHSQPTRNSSPSTATSSHGRGDQREPQHKPNRLVDTPKSSTRDHSESSGSSRKRTHDSRSAHVPSPKPDTTNPTGKALDKISEAIWKNYMNSKQSTQRLYMKENLRQTLEGIIQLKYQGTMLFLVGSSLNGFATNSSDTDLCLMVSSKELNQKHHATYILNVLHNLILQRSNFVSEAQVIYAKVPILKFVCSSTYSGLDCDININNATGIRNTHLLQIYSKIDWRVAPLVVLIKQWASAQGINDASQGTLSSYSLVLMVINYLQAKCEPCVLPCLHQLHSSTFNSHSDVRFLYDTHPCNPLPSYITFQSKNTNSIWDLYRGFFAYYVEEFRFQTNVICVRLGNTYPLANAPYHSRDWVEKYIYIEEPFDRNNTARAVYNDTNFRRIMRTFEKTHRKLNLLGKTDSVDPEEALDFIYEWLPKDTPPVKKKRK
ncbi:poly(A) RNA polymerase GLD2-like isoform X2 [Patiria miniata]|nr:poly(A) RNA polymerase GLD2-like isoform X2 [Patiria miniata]XP_038072653.1 poly(A) RNA polymerase GLD2-like isoform X2 [Patiria miniata]XP_038072654.1 poly(A) RNA polymerase GLD2-like isoform X2 [Patiria miniata]